MAPREASSRGRIILDSDTYHQPGQQSYSAGGTFTYDLANNLNATGTNHWFYNSDNQLTSATTVLD